MFQMVKNPPAMQDTQVRALVQENPLEKEMATLSSISAWRILWTEEPGGLQSMESQRVRHDGATNTHKFHTLFTFPWILPDALFVLLFFQDPTQVTILPLFVIFS